MTDVEAVRDSLREVVDPCSAATGSHLDIVEMGLVKSVDVSDGHVCVDMRLTSPACFMIPYFIEEVETRVCSLPGIESVELETDDGFEWSADMMSEEAKERRQAVLDRQATMYRQQTTGESDGTDGARSERGDERVGNPASPASE